ncbi:D-erythronate dehydrogenase [Streptomyces griseiscabiei]|uniref:NAD-dependent epimerase/dehydratase family protein n=2 Tax=Streptomyces griseiscabiei TaxID=2993540 RepID=A0ABU4L6U6_9ACTN|nr:D-erythronate dehydrogenase [Streptomyces griseiscabiei]MBZ3906226.1 NAD-dependent epimerase/dehydratase family protein [Streptomyces griseiscabiei]MDX2911221.1 NAD-dependent epimerase/dehydratase family protein [Streptomyces griseiscabiei]
MRVVITGGSGFLGNLLAKELLRRDLFRGERISELVLLDRVTRPAEWGDERVTEVQGDLLAVLEDVFSEPVDAIFHLAAAVSADCEVDFDLGMRSNVDTTRGLLEATRKQQGAGGPRALVVLASSVAVYGQDPEVPAPEMISEQVLPLPASSYGAQKTICEQLTADYTRKGFLDGRVVRLMTVAIRPGTPNGAASGFLSGIIREPLNGQASTCPVDPSLRVAIASPRNTISGLVKVAEARRGKGAGDLAGRLPINLPSLTVSVEQMLEELRRIAGDEVAGLVKVDPDPSIEAIVGSWPARFDNRRAIDLGIEGDSSFHDVVQQYIADYVPARSHGGFRADGRR